MSAAPFKRMAGVSLIELMVAMVIGLLLTFGAVTVYMQSRDTYRTTETAARLQEVARYAIELMEPDVRSAGYWGMTNRPEWVHNQVADASIVQNCGPGWVANADASITALDNGAWGLTCAATSLASGTDVLIVRRASAETALPDASRVQVTSNRMRAVVFKASTIPSDFGAAPASETRNVIATAYYVSNPSAGQFELRRRSLQAATMVDEPLIPGVQDLQVQFGVDRNGDNMADQYVNPGAIPAGARIVSARIWVLVVADDREGGTDPATYTYANRAYAAFNDGRRRVVMSKTIQIRNSRA